MALRTVRVQGDPVLGKRCREVREMTPRLRELVEDMFETMYTNQGAGLAAPQVGVLRKIAVVEYEGKTYKTLDCEYVAIQGRGAAAPAPAAAPDADLGDDYEQLFSDDGVPF